MPVTIANALAGGFKAYLAPEDTPLPTLTDLALDFEVNEKQTITITGTPTGGDFTLEIVYADGSSETTAAIAYDATAADVKAALAALDNLAATDMTATGGALPGTPVVIEFIGAYANTVMNLLIANAAGLTGGTAPAIAITRTQTGRLWTPLPDPMGDTEVAWNDEREELRSAYSKHRNYSVITALGIDSVKFPIKESDLDAMNLGMLSTLKAVTAAGAGTAGYEKLSQATKDSDIPYYSLILQKRGPVATGWGQFVHLFRVRRKLTGSLKSGSAVTQIPIEFEVFADADATPEFSCAHFYEYIADATGA